METVKLHITIEISTEDEAADTGLTVAEWNAMTDEERSDVMDGIWSEMAGGANNGGISVVTEGAEGS
jgi:hypothetical protein